MKVDSPDGGCGRDDEELDHQLRSVPPQILRGRPGSAWGGAGGRAEVCGQHRGRQTEED